MTKGEAEKQKQSGPNVIASELGSSYSCVVLCLIDGL